MKLLLERKHLVSVRFTLLQNSAMLLLLFEADLIIFYYQRVRIYD